VNLDVSFARGEEMRTEVSAKFRREGVTAELDAAGFDLTEWLDRQRRTVRAVPRHRPLKPLHLNH